MPPTYGKTLPDTASSPRSARRKPSPMNSASWRRSASTSPPRSRSERRAAEAPLRGGEEPAPSLDSGRIDLGLAQCRPDRERHRIVDRDAELALELVDQEGAAQIGAEDGDRLRPRRGDLADHAL